MRNQNHGSLLPDCELIAALAAHCCSPVLSQCLVGAAEGHIDLYADMDPTSAYRYTVQNICPKVRPPAH